MATVSLEKLSKQYGSRWVVDELTLKCGEGELLVLLGAAGAGKTTTLKMIAGIEEPTNGIVRVGERVINALPPERRNVAMAFENYALYTHLTVSENIAFPLRARVRSKGRSDASIHSAVRETARILEIDSLLDRLPGQLSGGQRQRVSLGRALVREPDVMLLDEPIAHLDAQLRATLRGQLKRLLKERGVTTIYSTPDYTQALGMADRLGVLESGRLVQLDTPMNVYENPLTIGVAEMLGDPRVNIFDAKIEATDGNIFAVTTFGRIPLESWTTRFEANIGAEVSLGIRPSDLHVENCNEDDKIVWNVELAEPLGATIMLAVSYRGVQLRCIVPAKKPYIAGDRVAVRVDSKRILAFDRASGRSLDLTNMVA